MQRMLDRVPSKYDKKQGSIIWNALTPAAAELAQMYIDLGLVEDRTYADTATGEYLTRRAAERGVNRYPATKAIRKGIFKTNDNLPLNIPIGSRFTGEDLNYTVIEKITDGEFKLECEEPGAIGNTYTGTLIPVEYIENLVSAELADILIPGEDEEDDEHLRKRYFDSLESQAFGGNIADYKKKTNELNGVGGVKVYPVWAGGGTVKLVIIDSDYNKPSTELIDYIQTEIDPTQHQGQGVGIAPIDHIVTVEGVTERIINIETSITFQEGYTWVDVEPNFRAAINDYFHEMKKTWQDEENLVIRISYIETRALGLPGVLDIQNTKINGVAENLVLADIEIPLLGEVVVI
ncbi:baseplate J/gp47 family protein [Clostridium sp. Cult1]|uniref:baseplate J/gp47 family protein n=1 Tax=Clostridium sp. Cult1 TaxID=2079002 RepID=UPI001F289126|nr:baseplate J/gp47 family protein [Clostridium sp. Cult1]MCF6464213.1 phage tail protein [Clostridium sp. Cult1]